MKTITIATNLGKVSDGYHTFDELYEHRHALFLALLYLLRAEGHRESCWMSKLHEDGTSMKGWFVAGAHLPTGDVTYHLPIRLWKVAIKGGIPVLPKAPPFDGHTSTDVIARLNKWVTR